MSLLTCQCCHSLTYNLTRIWIQAGAALVSPGVFNGRHYTSIHPPLDDYYQVCPPCRDLLGSSRFERLGPEELWRSFCGNASPKSICESPAHRLSDFRGVASTLLQEKLCRFDATFTEEEKVGLCGSLAKFMEAEFKRDIPVNWRPLSSNDKGELTEHSKDTFPWASHWDRLLSEPVYCRNFWGIRTICRQVATPECALYAELERRYLTSHYVRPFFKFEVRNYRGCVDILLKAVSSPVKIPSIRFDHYTKVLHLLREEPIGRPTGKEFLDQWKEIARKCHD